MKLIPYPIKVLPARTTKRYRPGRMYAFGKGLGADPEMVAIFTSQLQTYKDQLLSAYRTKNMLIAERESLRFKYLTGWRSLFETTLNNIITDQYGGSLPTTGIFAGIITKLKGVIPMLSLSGGQVVPYKLQGALYIYYRENKMLSFLASMNDLMIQPFFGSAAANKQPTIVVHKTRFSTMTPESLVKEGFYDDWLNYLKSYPLPTEIAAYFNKNYGKGTLGEILIQGNDLLVTVMQKTLRIIQLQYTIEDIEAQISNFITEYRSYGVTELTSVSDIFKEMQALSLASAVADAEAAAKAAALTVPVGALIVESAPTVNAPLVEENSLIVSAPEVSEEVLAKKSGFPVIGALAAAGIFLMVRNK